MTTNADIVRALLKLRPGAEWTLRGDTLKELEWLDEKQSRPSDGEILTIANDPKPVLVGYASKKRWEVEVGGIVVNGIQVPTDDRAKLLILGAAQTLTDDATAPFIAGGVDYGTLTGVQFRAVNDAIILHVQKSFQTLSDVLSKIVSGGIKDIAGIEAAFK